MGVFAFSWTMDVLAGLLGDIKASYGENSFYDDELINWLIINRRFEGIVTGSLFDAIQ
jgi:hypothetical protein